MAASPNPSTLGELNRNYWNVQADTMMKQEWALALGDQITTYIQTHVEWIGVDPSKPVAPVRMLDYACGNGVASRALAPHVTTLRGIDVSDTMVEKYNAAARQQGLSEQQMLAVQGDLLATPENTSKAIQTPDFYGFDVIVTSMSLHHFEDPQQMATKLVERLKDGGSILIIDWVTEANQNPNKVVHNHDHHHSHSNSSNQEETEQLQAVRRIMSRLSFDENEMISILKQAGCTEADFVLHPEVSKLPDKFGGEKRLFFARGKK